MARKTIQLNQTRTKNISSNFKTHVCPVLHIDVVNRIKKRMLIRPLI